MRPVERKKKYNYYAVRKGRVPGIYTSWSKADKQVKGFSGCDFKGFKSRRDALKYMNRRDHRDVADAGGSKTLQTPSLPKRTQMLEPLLVVDGHVGGSSGAGGPDVTASGSSSAAAGGSQNDPGEEKFVVKEDIVFLLKKVCGALSIGTPMYKPSTYHTTEGGMLVGFSVTLPKNSMDMQITAEGLLDSDRRKAKQDAALKMIEEILKAKGLQILDFNYYRNRALAAENARLKEQIAAMKFSKKKTLQP